MEDTEDDLTKLFINWLEECPVSSWIAMLSKIKCRIQTTEAAIMKSLTVGSGKKEVKEDVQESSVAKLVEEMKALPSRVAERIAESG